VCYCLCSANCHGFRKGMVELSLSEKKGFTFQALITKREQIGLRRSVRSSCICHARHPEVSKQLICWFPRDGISAQRFELGIRWIIGGCNCLLE